MSVYWHLYLLFTMTLKAMHEIIYPQTSVQDPTNANCTPIEEKIQQIQRWLKSLKWRKTTVPKCRGGFSLMHVSPLVQSVVQCVLDRPFPHQRQGIELPRWTEGCQPVVLVGWVQSTSCEESPWWRLQAENCCQRNTENLGENGERTSKYQCQ